MHIHSAVPTYILEDETLTENEEKDKSSFQDAFTDLSGKREPSLFSHRKIFYREKDDAPNTGFSEGKQWY